MLTERCEDDDTPPPGPHAPDIFWQTDDRAFEPLIYAPPKLQLPWYWEKFVELVDPFVKILHIPTTAPLFLNFDAATTPIDAQPLFFAICYAVACSLRPSDCATRLQDDQRALTLKYKAATQRALGAARFLATQELRVLQALVLLMSCGIRGGREAEEAWTLTGVVVRLAQHMGLHREEQQHDAAALSPFAAELRRRAWWQVCVLDLHVAEVRGAESSVLDVFADARMPANVRDEDIGPGMRALPAARKGCTEMTWGLISFEIADVVRRLGRAARAQVALRERCAIVDDFAARVEDEYLAGGAKRDGPLVHCCRALFRCFRSRLLLLLHRPFRRPDLPQDVKDTLFSACLEALESWHYLNTDTRLSGRISNFRSTALFQVHIFVLLQLCDGRNDVLAERAWHMVMVAQLPHSDEALEPRMRRIIDPLSRLLESAKRFRELQLQQGCLDAGRQALGADIDGQLHPNSIPTTSILPPADGSTADAIQGYRSSTDRTVDTNRAEVVAGASSGDGVGNTHPLIGGFNATLSADLTAFLDELPDAWIMDVI